MPRVPVHWSGWVRADLLEVENYDPPIPDVPPCDPIPETEPLPLGKYIGIGLAIVLGIAALAWAINNI